MRKVRVKEDMTRVFSAIDVSADMREKLADVQEELDDGFNRVDPDQFHVTLQFFEDIADAEIERVAAAMDDMAVGPFQTVVKGVGAFPSRDFISVVWAGLQATELYRLHDAVAGHDVPADDTHDFHPHVTLLRVDHLSGARKRVLQEKIASLEEARIGAFTVDHVTLYRSELTPDGPVYEKLHRVGL